MLAAALTRLFAGNAGADEARSLVPSDIEAAIPTEGSSYENVAYAKVLRRCLLTTLLVLVLGAFGSAPCCAATIDPATFVDNIGNQLLSLAKITCLQHKLAAFRKLSSEEFDVPSLGRFVLGRFSRMLSPTERDEFQALFQTLFEDVVVTYIDRLTERGAANVVLTVTGSRFDSDGPIVSSQALPWFGREPAARPIQIVWRLIGHDSGYRIVDLTLGDLSMAIAGRDDIEEIVRRNNSDAHAIPPVMRAEVRILQQRRAEADASPCVGY